MLLSFVDKKIRTGISFGENEMKNVNDASKDGG